MEVATNETLAPGTYPSFRVAQNEHPNRLWAFPILGFIVKIFILIPVFLWMWLVGVGMVLASLLNSLSVLFAGEYWVPAYALGRGFMHLMTRTYLYMAGITDRYPGFALAGTAEGRASLDQPGVTDWEMGLEIPLPAHPGRAFAIPILGGLARGILMIPYGIWASILASGAGLAVCVASAPVLFQGRYPESVYELTRDALRVELASTCYSLGLSDSYPSLSISMNHASVKWTFIILGVILQVSRDTARLGSILKDSGLLDR
jgi:hypothetical protein